MAKKRWFIDLDVSTAGVFEAETEAQAIKLAKQALKEQCEYEIEINYCYEVNDDEQEEDYNE